MLSLRTVTGNQPSVKHGGTSSAKKKKPYGFNRVCHHWHSVRVHGINGDAARHGRHRTDEGLEMRSTPDKEFRAHRRAKRVSRVLMGVLLVAPFIYLVWHFTLGPSAGQLHQLLP